MRVSIDDSGSGKKPSSLMDDVPSSSGKKKKGGGGAGLDKAQKIKAAVAIAVIILAGGFIAWSNGLLDGKPRANASGPPDVTPEDQNAFDQNQQPKSTGSTRLPPPMPLGSN